MCSAHSLVRFGWWLPPPVFHSPRVAQELGTITFPTSGDPAAQPKFVEGVKALHSFQFDEAAIAFREAQAIDADFALAYWGEAMSHNHPLWAQQDLEAARKLLEQLAPTPEARAAKASLATERAFLAAAELLFYGPDDKLARDKAYSAAMAGMYERWPDDHEVATFYALSLLGTVRAGDGGGFRRQALAASIAQRVFEDNPNHPGAAHFIIHSFDDPDHAPLGLPAARAYAGIAPAAAHALHMPSHIFVQLGMWDDVVRSNVDAYAAAAEINARLKLAEGREDFHTLSWLMYGNLMLGRYEDARANVALARAAAERNPENAGIRDGWLAMRGRYLFETAQWEEIALDGSAAHAGHDDRCRACRWRKPAPGLGASMRGRAPRSAATPRSRSNSRPTSGPCASKWRERASTTRAASRYRRNRSPRSPRSRAETRAGRSHSLKRPRTWS